MSIAPVSKVTFVGHTADRQKVLADLQEIGCLHLLPLAAGGEGAAAEGATPQARDALEFLLSCPQKRRQATKADGFDPVETERKALEVRNRLNDLADERDYLRKRIADLAPWGDFELPPLEEMGGRRLWFYVVPHYRMKEVEATGLCWEVVRRDNRFRYVAVVSEGEPEGMPVPRTHTGARPLHELEARLEEAELAIEDAESERQGLTRWCLLLARSLDMLEDRAARAHAATLTCEADPVFALQAWAPNDRVPQLREYAEKHGMVFEAADPDPGEQPPTLLENPPAIAGGEDLINFYMTPGYWGWDPSPVVFFSFAVFFGMIMADVGYGALFGAVVFYFWKKMGQTQGGKRFRNVLAALSLATIAYGALVGSYFGWAPPPETLLGTFQILDLNDAPTMMLISIIIGAVHVALANVMDAWRLGATAKALAPLGWAGLVLGGLAAFVGGQAGVEGVKWAGVALVAGGGVLILGFTGAGERPLTRAIQGAMAVTKLTSAFGDVLSYLRLFALGLASASLAVAFNDMAGQIKKGIPGVGLFFAMLVLVAGHGINFVLGLSSGFIHGLRLNVIEFFNWGVKEEGNLYKVFRRKETAWNL